MLNSLLCFWFSAFYLSLTDHSSVLLFIISFTEPKPLRLRALELAIQSLRETFELKEKELEYPIKDLHNQQVDGLR